MNLAMPLLVGAMAGAPLVGGIAAVDDGVAQLQASGYFVGGSVASVDGHGEEIALYGQAAVGGTSVASDSIFDIGSVTKSFVGILLASLELEGKVGLDDSVGMYISELKNAPFASGITLRQLATMTSGLPGLPDGFKDYASYSQADLLGFLTGYAPPAWTPASGRTFGRLYSNTGFGLLGLVVQRAAKAADFESLVKERITGPLGLGDTTVILSPEQQSRYVAGYDIYGSLAPHWSFVKDGVVQVMAPAGALHSTPTDMQKYLVALTIADEHSPLGKAITESRSAGLGWDTAADGVVAKNGATAGFHAYLWSSRTTGQGLFVVGNVGFFGIEGLVPAYLSGQAVPDWRGLALTRAQMAAVDGVYDAKDPTKCGDAATVATLGRYTTVTSDGQPVGRFDFVTSTSAYLFDDDAVYAVQFTGDGEQARSFTISIGATSCVFMSR